MNSINDLKMLCVGCGIVCSVFMSSGGRYICKECGHEVHDDEPVKSQSVPSINWNLNSPSLSGTASIGFFSPSPGPGGTN